MLSNFEKEIQDLMYENINKWQYDKRKMEIHSEKEKKLEDLEREYKVLKSK